MPERERMDINAINEDVESQDLVPRHEEESDGSHFKSPPQHLLPWQRFTQDKREMEPMVKSLENELAAHGHIPLALHEPHQGFPILPRHQRNSSFDLGVGVFGTFHSLDDFVHQVDTQAVSKMCVCVLE